MPRVNPDILRWARETAGLTPEEAVSKLGIKQARGVSAIDRLAALEDGDLAPSRPVLVRMAKQYRRPLLTFYLSAPPKRGDRGSDFRSLAGPSDPTDDALLDAMIRGIRARQSMVRAVLEDEDEAEPIAFVASRSTSSGVASVLASIKDLLQLSLETYRAQRSSEDAFRSLREGAESAGVFVLLMGDLGSHHTALSPDVFRGFALADAVAPFVVINDHDSRAAWSFTLLHELAHLCMGQTGVSATRTDLAVERFCNEVAGEFLLPAKELAQTPSTMWSESDTLSAHITKYARDRNLSSTMVAYRLMLAGTIDAASYQKVSSEFRQRWLSAQARRREAAREREGGPSFYVVRSHRVGNALIDLVARMVRTHALTTSKAGKVLGVKAQQVQALLDVRAFGGPSRTT